jgi:hypothetical protein
VVGCCVQSNEYRIWITQNVRSFFSTSAAVSSSRSTVQHGVSFLECNYKLCMELFLYMLLVTKLVMVRNSDTMLTKFNVVGIF